MKGSKKGLLPWRGPKNVTRRALVELCRRGLLTCTRGEPGADGATYALAWLPLDDPEQFSPAVRRQHDENMRRLGIHVGREQ